MASYTPTVECSHADFIEHTDECDGVCLYCEMWTMGGCEPDARNYLCENCGRRAVFGAELALLLGRLKVTDLNESLI